jgi:hypothetical protein
MGKYNGGPNNMRQVKYKQNEYDAKKADGSIKYCTKCRKCWEITVGSAQSNGKKRRNLLYYDNFVSYGKEKKICKMCKGE